MARKKAWVVLLPNPAGGVFDTHTAALKSANGDTNFIRSYTNLNKANECFRSHNGKKWFVVFRGYKPGVYDNESDVKTQVRGFENSSHVPFINEKSARRVWENHLNDKAESAERARLRRVAVVKPELGEGMNNEDTAWVVFRGHTPGVYLSVSDALDRCQNFTDSHCRGYRTSPAAWQAWNKHLQTQGQNLTASQSNSAREPIRKPEHDSQVESVSESDSETDLESASTSGTSGSRDAPQVDAGLASNIEPSINARTRLSHADISDSASGAHMQATGSSALRNEAKSFNKRKASTSTLRTTLVAGASIDMQSDQPEPIQPPQKRIKTELPDSVLRQSVQQSTAMVQSQAHQLDRVERIALREVAATSLYTGPMVHILVGGDIEQKFTIHKGLICHHSSYFDDIFARQGQNDTIQLLPTSIAVFTMFNDWLYTSNILPLQPCLADPPQTDTWELNLIQLWLLGDTACTPKVQDAAIHWLHRLVDEAEHFELDRLIRLLPYVFDNTPDQSMLRMWIIDNIIYQMTQQDFNLKNYLSDGGIRKFFHEEALCLMRSTYSGIMKEKCRVIDRPRVDSYLLSP